MISRTLNSLMRAYAATAPGTLDDSVACSNIARFIGRHEKVIASALEAAELADAIRAKMQEPIFLKMRSDLPPNYRTPTEIAACCVWAGEPSPGSKIRFYPASPLRKPEEPS